MALPYGDWTATVNGAETILHIDPPDAQGVFTGQIFGGRIKGFWNEASQKIQFASYAEEGGGITSPVFGIFEGYLFRTPLNPAPGRDVTATLVARCSSARNPWAWMFCRRLCRVLADSPSAGWRSFQRRSRLFSAAITLSDNTRLNLDVSVSSQTGPRDSLAAPRGDRKYAAGSEGNDDRRISKCLPASPGRGHLAERLSFDSAIMSADESD